MALLEAREYHSASDMMADYADRRARSLLARPVKVAPQVEPPVIDRRPRWRAPLLRQLPSVRECPSSAWRRDVFGMTVVLINDTEHLLIEPSTDVASDPPSWMVAPDGSECSNAKDVLKAICRHRGVTMSEMLSERRFLPLVHARQEACYWIARMSTLSLPAIGITMAGRDHTTVRHGIIAHARRSGLPSLYLGDREKRAVAPACGEG